MDDFAQFFQQAGPGFFGFDFDMGGGGAQARPRKGKDAVIPHEVTLEELYNGKSVKLNMEKEIVCGLCSG